MAGSRDVLALPPQMPRVAAGGVSAYADVFALGGHDTYGAGQLELWFLSLLGPQQSVKSLWAQALKGALLTLTWDEARETRMARLAFLGKDGWKRHMTALPAAAAHQVVLVPRIAHFHVEGSEFLLLPRREDEAARLHWRRLNRATDLPLYPSWDGWLWERALRLREAIPLASRGLLAYRCQVNLARLTEDVGDAVRTCELGVKRAEAA